MAKTIEPKLSKIGDYLALKNNEKFVIPTYQRAYSWGVEACKKLWEDINEFAESGAEDPYFFGNVIVDCSTEGELQLIDGQQRTTTFLLLLKALQLRLDEKIETSTPTDKEEEKLKSNLIKQLDRALKILFKADDDLTEDIKDDWGKTKGRQILKTNSFSELYKDEFQKIIFAKNFEEVETNVTKIPNKKKDNQYTNFFRNFKFFYESIGDEPLKLKKFSEVFLNKCEVIAIFSWNTEQAIEMFNSLNGTGVPLNSADIIAAKMFSAAEEKEKLKDAWENVIKRADELKLEKDKDKNLEAILLQYMYIQRARDGKAEMQVPGVRQYYTNLNKELLNDPLKLCGEFQKLLDLWENAVELPAVKLLLKFNANAKYYLISFLSRFEASEISSDEANAEILGEVNGVCECLLRLFALLELGWVGYSSKELKAFLFSENVKIVNPKISLDDIKADFDKQIKKEWEKDKDGIKDWLLEYKGKVLVFLNEYLFTKEIGEEFDFFNNTEVEHVMPSSGRNIESIRKDAGIENNDDFETFVDLLGNKILLEEEINSNISNACFRSKKNGYKDSKFALAKALAGCKKEFWKKKDIENATKEAAERIVKFVFGE